MAKVRVLHAGKWETIDLQHVLKSKAYRTKLSKWRDLNQNAEFIVKVSPHPRLFDQCVKSGKKAIRGYYPKRGK